MSKFFRTITDNYPQLDWDTKNKNYLDLKRCHLGQLKLLYSEIEFLTIASKFYDLSKCVVLYIGSAPGHHIVYLQKLFPEIEWILYDPADFFIKENDHVEIHSGKDGFFTDDTIKEVKKK
jgi:hypothetical protein